MSSHSRASPIVMVASLPHPQQVTLRFSSFNQGNTLSTDISPPFSALLRIPSVIALSLSLITATSIPQFLRKSSFILPAGRKQPHFEEVTAPTVAHSFTVLFNDPRPTVSVDHVRHIQRGHRSRMILANFVDELFWVYAVAVFVFPSQDELRC